MDCFLHFRDSNFNAKIDRIKKVLSMLDRVMNMAASMMEKASRWLTFPAIPWEKFSENWGPFIDGILGWNKIFPVSTILIIFGLMLSVFGALIIFYGIILVKSFIPFSGGK